MVAQHVLRMASCCCPALAAPTARHVRPAARAWALQRPRGSVAPSRRCLALVTSAAARTSSGGPGADTGASDDPTRDFASSLALMVLGAALVSERINGEGIVAVMELDHPMMEPVLWAVAAVMAVAAAWPSKSQAHNLTDTVRQLAGRAAFAGLAAALAIELYTGSGLLAVLDFKTGAALSEAEALLAALVLLVLTGPRKVTAQ